MAAIKISKFLGAAPKISPELLPDAAAQIASNVKVYSGDLIPYHQPVIVDNVGRNGVVQAIYPLRNPENPSELKWLSWLSDVDVAVTTALNEEEQRIYYTGDGVPKATDYELAIQGAGPYPVTGYDLGLPLPETIPTATVASFTAATTSTYSRDSGNIATIVTAAAHNFKTGQVVTVSGFTTTAGKTFNATNVRLTVTNDTTFTYFNSGDAVSSTSDSAGRVNLAGNTITRNYVFTWITPWGEESIPSDPSETVYLKEGQVVTVGNLPITKPAGNNYIAGFRLYRTITSSSGTDYFRLRTVWFTTDVVSAARSANTVTLVMDSDHNLLVGDKVKVLGIAFGGVDDTTFDITDGIVTEVPDDKTFKYIKNGADQIETECTGGVLYWDISESETDTSRYYESNTFTDDYDPDGLRLLLESRDYDPPDPAMRGLTTIQNNILCGFFGNELCFSEPNKPWAWPIKYRLVFDSPIVGVSPVAGSVLVLTESFPFLVSGNTPANMSYARIDAPYPCTSKRGITNVGYGVVFPTYGGLGVYNPSAGIDLVTKLVHDWDTWGQDLDPTTVVAAFYAGKYFASHGAGSFIFEREDKVGGFFVTAPVRFSAAYYDTLTNKFYFVSDTSGSLSEWDANDQPLLPLEWKSKVIVTKDYMNLGAARVVGDYSVPSEETDAIIAFNATVAPYNAEFWALVAQLGTVNGPVDYVDPNTSARVDVLGTVNSMLVNGDPLTIYQRPITGAFPVTFKLWANKELVCDVTVDNSDIFRLPSGYRSDTFEVAVSGSARVRAIHIGETPFGLRTA
jgi:hypothetical protein